MIDNLTAVIAYRNGAHVIERTLDALPNDLPVIVADDMSTPPFETARPNVQVIRRTTRGYPAGGYNAGLAVCQTDAVLIGQDNVLQGTAWLDLIVSKRSRYATIGDGVFGHPAWRKGYVQATCMFMRKDARDHIGLFNAVDYPAWGTTAEWQLRVCRAGYAVLPTKIPGLVHERKSKSYGDSFREAMRDEPEKIKLFLRTPPMISVIVPCHNYGRYLSDALASLMGGQTSLGKMSGQTFQSFEVIIVDDASTDDSLEIAKSLADEWKGIHVFRNVSNVGTAETLNAGIRQAHGQYVSILSADDMMQPTRLEKMLRTLETNSHSFVYDDLQIFRQGKLGETLLMMQPYDFDKLLVKNQIPSGLLYSKQAWDDTGGYPTLFSNGREDWAFNVALGSKGYCGVHVREPLYLYRREQQNRSLRNTTPEWRRRFLGQMQETFPDLYAGRRSDMCCGSSNRNGNARQAAVARARMYANASSIPQLAGASGMITVEYIGGAAGEMQFQGKETGTQYLFGGRRKIGYVDERDLTGLLGLYHNQRPLFRRVVVAQTVAAAPAQTEPVEPVKLEEPKEQKEQSEIQETASAQDTTLTEEQPRAVKTPKPRLARKSPKNKND